MKRPCGTCFFILWDNVGEVKNMNYTPNPYPSQGYMQYRPYQAYQPYQSIQQPQGYSPSSMPVSSKEEAMAAPADFSGAPMVFADFSHGKIYVKQWNAQKGAADFVVFAPEVQAEPEPEKAPAGDYISKSTFRKEMEKLYAEIDKLKGAKTYEPDDE